MGSLESLLGGLDKPVLVSIVIVLLILIFFLLRKYLKHIEHKTDILITNMQYLKLEMYSQDVALDKCLPGNGKGYAEHKKDAMEKKLQQMEARDILQKSRKETFFEYGKI